MNKFEAKVFGAFSRIGISKSRDAADIWSVQLPVFDKVYDNFWVRENRYVNSILPVGEISSGILWNLLIKEFETWKKRSQIE